MELSTIQISNHTKERLKKYGLCDDNADRVILRLIMHLEYIKEYQRKMRHNRLLLEDKTKRLLVDCCPFHLTYNDFICFLVDIWLKQPYKISGYF